MFRREILDLIRETVAQEGYAFFTGFQYRINAELVSLPAVWVLPPKAITVQGRDEGFVTYRVEMFVLVAGKLHAGQLGKESEWDRIETQAHRFVTALTGKEPVLHVEHVSMEPAEFSVSKHGELSVKVTYDVTAYFRNRQQ